MDLTKLYRQYLDKKFGQHLDQLDKMNAGITVKENIITANKYHEADLNRKIAALTYTFLYIVVFFILIMFMRYQLLSAANGSIILVLFTCYIAWKMYATYYSAELAVLEAKLEAVADKLKESPDDPTKCPWTCPDAPAVGFIDLRQPSAAGTKGYVNELDKDYSTNKWVEGDRPDFGPIPVATATTYKCRWANGVAAPGRKYMPAEFISTIPCERYPGYINVA